MIIKIIIKYNYKNNYKNINKKYICIIFNYAYLFIFNYIIS